ncbi:SGNH/GDSL hydrolase family protein [Hufsiella ginkgonis]|uniref:Twin-arginine translocation signal domain-containing protein n=1 Tax=Hufsiella ginkgonis TaxID=2695274 RepID=A0A7K1XZ38_9SPHI|nr:SGNH/GDSL hydrolase family protein [Hufsiella ginkgonis]MXV16230.1 twin-arginine translocation signal domain-containing protein [Hufsiella ginkgonis]
MEHSTNRRNFLKTASVGGMMALSLPAIVQEAFAAEKSSKIKLAPGDTYLFQGDSITDAGRNKTTKDFNNAAALGSGYAFLTAGALLRKHAELRLKIYNKGISGNKVYQLAERWDADCLDIKPNVMSILIGVNDYWHMRNGNYPAGTPEKYINDFRALLERTKQKLPGIKLIIAEPFAVVGGTAVNETWTAALAPYQEAARKLSAEFSTAFIPLQSVFDKAAANGIPGTYWTADGVHPSLAGAQLMAEAWLQVLK